MGMNQVEEAMIRFESTLEAFHETVKGSMQQIEHTHEQVNPLWQDTMRQSYDERWVPLYEQLREYRDRVGPKYIEVMIERLNFLRRYLHGN